MRRLSTTPGVEAKAAGAEGDDLEETTGHSEVLEEIQKLHLIGEIVVECERRHDAENGEGGRNQARTIAQQQRDAAEQLDRNRDAKREHGHRKTDRLDVANHHRRSGDFGYS